MNEILKHHGISHEQVAKMRARKPELHLDEGYSAGQGTAYDLETHRAFKTMVRLAKHGGALHDVRSKLHAWQAKKMTDDEAVLEIERAIDAEAIDPDWMDAGDAEVHDEHEHADEVED